MRPGVDAEIAIGLSLAAQRDALAAKAKSVARLAVEADGITWAQQRVFAGEWFPDAELVATEGLVDRERQVKDAGEVARIAAAAEIADGALAAVLPRLKDGPTERDFALELDSEIRRRGADGTSFETIVGSGPNGAKPHARPGDRRIEQGDLVVIDFGAKVDGYCSDMTRTFSIGDAVADRGAHARGRRRGAAGGGRRRGRGGGCARRRRGGSRRSSSMPDGATRSCIPPATRSVSRSTSIPVCRPRSITCWWRATW